jgi:hypothetical protein
MQGILVGTERERERERVCVCVRTSFAIRSCFYNTINLKYLLQKHEIFIRILFIKILYDLFFGRVVGERHT